MSIKDYLKTLKMNRDIEKFAYYLCQIDYTSHKFRLSINLMIQEINDQLEFIHREEIPTLIEITRLEQGFQVISEEISNKIRVLETIKDTLIKLISDQE